MRIKKIVLAIAVVSSAAASLTGCAQQGGGSAESAYPEGPVKVLVPFAPGSATDVLARIWADCYERELGSPFVVENREGGSGSIGMTEAAASKPDGYTVVFGSSSSAVITPFNTKGAAYTVDSFTPVGQVALTNLYVAVPKDSPINSIEDLVEKGKTSTLVVADSGKTTLSGLVTEGLARNYGITVNHVTPSSMAEIKRGLDQGDYDMGLVTVDKQTVPWVLNKDLKALAVIGKSSPKWAPELKTLDELGFGEGQLAGPGNLGYWAVPAKTDGSIVDKLEATAATCLRDARVQETIGEFSLPAEPMASAKIQESLHSTAKSLEGLAKP
ncbi:tripartite tricarboxylate transporter substrate binding protein [Pseudarthrobacter sulfonivorans]|uniref:tripartite tricarboxylate transporter substrate binding protein n=1 Tax=Pseudarthrobacter sulfonivorans TaxID=121292 RepID=UPI0009F91FD9|nr:tripartite tricarboxylate transporter substrate binding protein [Pseudarthrobacter sulfonivorans]